MASDRPSNSTPNPADKNRSEREPKSAPAAVQDLPAGLYIVSTPIGNLRDITLRALDILSSVDQVLAEDTRVARRLLDAHSIRATLSLYHDHNGAQRRPDVIQRLADGARIALISDAGTPLVSDPGFKLVADAADAGCRIIPIPGASAALAGLVTSGLPSDRFSFCGFLPSKPSARKAAIEACRPIPGTLIFYETGPRLSESLADLAQILGEDRDAAIARELTKLFEETRRGTLQALSEHYAEAGPPKGEIVVLVGPSRQDEVTEADLDEALRVALAEESLKAASASVAEALNLPKRSVYQRALQLKGKGG